MGEIKAASALSLLLITPGEALALAQQWTPALLFIAGTAGTALALAVRNYRAIDKVAARAQVHDIVLGVAPERRHMEPSSAPAVVPPSAEQQSTPPTAPATPQAGKVGDDG